MLKIVCMSSNYSLNLGSWKMFTVQAHIPADEIVTDPNGNKCDK